MKHLLLYPNPRRRRASRPRRSTTMRRRPARRRISRPRVARARRRTMRTTRRRMPVMRRYSRRASRVARRSPARRTRLLPVRAFIRNPSGGGGLVASLKGAVNKDTILLATGVILASTATSFVLGKVGTSLPGIGSTTGLIVYNAAIPILAGALVRRFSPSLSTGLYIGGLVAVGNALVNQVTAASTPAAATGAYLGQQQSLPRPLFNASQQARTRAMGAIPAMAVGLSAPPAFATSSFSRR